DADGITRAGRYALSILKTFQFLPEVSDQLELRFLAGTIAGCLVSGDSRCQLTADPDRAAQLLTKLVANNKAQDNWPGVNATAAVLALHSAATGRVPPPIVESVLNHAGTAATAPGNDDANSTTLMGRGLLLSRTDTVGARLLLEKGARKM